MKNGVFAGISRGMARVCAWLDALRCSAVGAFGSATIALLWCTHAQAAVVTPPAAECSALQAKYPQFRGKTLTNAINPHTPGYETVDPVSPDRYIGFDVDLGETIGACLGFKVDYKPVAFATLLPTLQAKQADFVISDIYATEERAKAADFITYSKVFDGVLVAKGNPKKINGINASLCDTTAAENTGYVEVPLIQALAPTCKAQGRGDAQVQLYDNNQTAIQAILAGRADTYINDVNTVDGAVKAYPEKLEKATAVTIPYSVGIAVPKGDLQMRAAFVDALNVLQKSGVQTAMLKKNNLPVENLEAPRLVLAK
ncbi:ABC transporter substrate-binding protein [Paraburkholderia silvatlantica]|uniref:Polar amino acid transport system substrate-binding protein n=1 Tax=Paraburkholderia silvatlantica TaxID=321895 RepID=A0ABR6FKV7_9BURK|nr:ABC transporter substrate-binding protein [Paraburkholderia silvatlantica]MBB2928062.1 polar amino acid transport system substrate-binding protein [Paraburkholderia silvatlantica]PVY31028.1 amino acid ABC transporter substrate-binding protein (PAAT family) [Paraburkholderia silvatlantica]PXW37164.1 amino acid ABC transporter substrate-binding protein (PAAT family) [Paraburkholderia silvatlantica]